MRSIIRFFSLFIFAIGCKTASSIPTSGTPAAQIIRKVISISETGRIITALASNQMDGREFRTKGFDRAAEWTITFGEKK